MRDPGPLPRPEKYYDQGWASVFVRKMETFMESLRGEWDCTSKFTTRSGRILNLTRVTSATYTVLQTDDVVDINSTQSVTLTLPSSPRTGERHQIQDSSGNALVNNITINPASGNINGSTTVTTNVNYGRVTAIYNGTRWILATG